MKKNSRYSVASFLVIFLLGVIWQGHETVYAGWFDGGKKKEEKSKTVKPIASAPKKAVAKPQPPKRDPKEIKAFNDRMQKERKEFEQKFATIPAGPKETASKEFEVKIRADRAALEQELKTYPSDEKEAAQKEFQQRMQKEQREFSEKMKSMPPGKKESMRAELEKSFQEGKKALVEKLKGMSPDPREAARKEFDANVSKETQDFYLRK